LLVRGLHLIWSSATEGGIPRVALFGMDVKTWQALQLQGKCRVARGSKGTFPGAGALSRNPPKRKANWR